MNPKRELRRHLRYLAAAPHHRRYGQYVGFADFVLQHGVWYKPRPLTGQPVNGGESFVSAFCRAALNDVPYVEGFVLTYGIALHHAWNLDGDGGVIDGLDTSAYLGVRFAVDRAASEAAALENFRERFPLYRQRQHGEPQGIVWPVKKWRLPRRR